jgi:hypothetical protein
MPLSSVVGAQSIVKPGVCTSSTRPASPFEGQMIYETDTDVLAIWNGSAWKQVAAATKTGSTLQVVSTTKTDTFSTTSTTYVDVTGLSVSITPSSTANKVFLMATISIGCDPSTTHTATRLLRDSTAIAVGDAAGSRVQASSTSKATATTAQTTETIWFLDSPATTSAITYKIQTLSLGGTTVGVNRSSDDSNSAGRTRTVSTITAMEIAG